MSTSEPERDLPVVITPLRLDDLDEVMKIERASFPLPWPASAYRHELTRNPHGYYLALRPRLSLQRHARLPPLLGYGGFWLFLDEAHICTIAIHPDYRRRGLGEWLLLHLMELAREVGADVATLEVREGNLAAQRLYRRTGFRQVGVRHRYYSDSGEDALIMTTPSLTSPEMRRLLAARRQAVAERLRAWDEELARMQPR
ncbi:MAG TPA: ribosomal protein S18-alanine N-acetyltransferase [Caldilineae bacterium]|nr:ribosomal protein S18-alanine N-acetyltransferase [Caldilineae bacterium]